MSRYGIAIKGSHAGEMTPCHAKNMDTCPYHSSHQNMTAQEAQRYNENVIAHHYSQARTLSKGKTTARHAAQRGSLKDRLKTKVKSFMDRKPASVPKITRAKRMVASALIMVSIMGASACGNPYYTETVDANPDTSVQQQQSTPQKSWKDDPVGKAEEKLQDFKNSGKYDEVKDKAKDLAGKAKDKLKDASGTVKEYAQSGQASADLQSMIDSLSHYGIGGSLKDVNSNSTVNDVYANVSKTQALQELSSLRIEQGNEYGYERSQWKHWIASMDAPDGSRTISRKPCFSVREQVLARQGETVNLTDNGCEVQVTMTDPYTGTSGHSQKDMQIDHSVPLGYAYAHGGSAWSAQKKEDYANDLSQGHLVAALNVENQAKSDKGPSQWMPDKDQCGYAKNFAHVLYKWDLSTTQADHDTMMNVIQQCAV